MNDNPSLQAVRWIKDIDLLPFSRIGDAHLILIFFNKRYGPTSIPRFQNDSIYQKSDLKLRRKERSIPASPMISHATPGCKEKVTGSIYCDVGAICVEVRGLGLLIDQCHSQKSELINFSWHRPRLLDDFPWPGPNRSLQPRNAEKNPIV